MTKCLSFNTWSAVYVMSYCTLLLHCTQKASRSSSICLSIFQLNTMASDLQALVFTLHCPLFKCNFHYTHIETNYKTPSYSFNPSCLPAITILHIHTIIVLLSIMSCSDNHKQTVARQGLKSQPSGLWNVTSNNNLIWMLMPFPVPSGKLLFRFSTSHFQQWLLLPLSHEASVKNQDSCRLRSVRRITCWRFEILQRNLSCPNGSAGKWTKSSSQYNCVHFGVVLCWPFPCCGHTIAPYYHMCGHMTLHYPVFSRG